MTPSQNGGIEQKIFEEFDNYAKSHPGTLYVYMGTQDGGYIQWPETKTSKSYDPRKRPWYITALEKNGEIIRTDPYTDSVTGSAIVSNARTFKNKNGNLYGVMAIDVSSAKLAQIMKEVEIGKTGYAMMLHKTGLILADPKNETNNLKNIKDINIEKMATILEEKSASAVEEQSVTTKEIAGSVSHAAQGIQEVNENVTQSSGVANEIAQDITDVSQTASVMSDSSTHIDTSAGALSQLSGKLKDTVNLFKI